MHLKVQSSGKTFWINMIGDRKYWKW